LKARDWRELTNLAKGSSLTIERVRMADTGIAIEGAFELPMLARLSEEDQVFIMAFLRVEGVIKEMEKLYGVSYPTIKNKLARIAAQLQFVEVIAPSKNGEIIEALERGDITAADAIKRLSQ